MIVVYVFLFAVAGLIVIGVYDVKSNFARRLEWYLTRETNQWERMGHKIGNCYWFIRCLSLKRWWRCRINYTLSRNYGMSWEGKEKEYSNRYGNSKD